MGESRQPDMTLQTKLGLLAMRYRRTRHQSERDKVAAEYRKVVAELIESKEWKVMPAFEDMLPDERMPREFFKFWKIPDPHDQDGGCRPTVKAPRPKRP